MTNYLIRILPLPLPQLSTLAGTQPKFCPIYPFYLTSVVCQTEKAGIREGRGEDPLAPSKV